MNSHLQFSDTEVKWTKRRPNKVSRLGQHIPRQSPGSGLALLYTSSHLAADAAVDGVGSAGDECGLVGAEIQDQPRNLLRLAHPPDGLVCRQLVKLLLLLPGIALLQVAVDK
eukprot:4844271-Prymnesium_polylepis.1